MTQLLPPPLEKTYEAVRLLGEGGFGTVVEARHRETGEKIAVKLLKTEMADPEMRQRFERESRITAKIRHPAVVRMLGAGVAPGGQAYILYEYIEGTDLENATGLDEDMIQEIGASVAEALHLAHQLGVVHRDLKPANVLLRRDGTPVLCDFGVARSSSTGTVVTATGILLGTPEFMAPELWKGDVASPTSDQWAWAATLYEALYRKGVLPKSDVPTIMRAALKGPPPEFPSLPSGSTSKLAGPLRKALSPNPAARYPDMASFAQALRTAGTRRRLVPGPDEDATRLIPASGRFEPEASRRAELPRDANSGSLLRPLLLGATCLALALLLFMRFTRTQAVRPSARPSPEPESPRPSSPEEPPEAVLRSQDRIEEALARLHGPFPPPEPGEPDFQSMLLRGRYMDAPVDPGDPERTRGRVMLEEGFRLDWERLVLAYQSWLNQLAIWQEENPELEVHELVWVQETMVDLGLREMRRLMVLYWLLQYPGIMQLNKIPWTERLGYRGSPRIGEFYVPVQDLADTLRSPPWDRSELARISAEWFEATEKISLYGERMPGWIERVEAAPQLDLGRAWTAQAVLQSLEADFAGYTERCPVYQRFARDFPALLDATPRLDLAPTRGGLLASHFVFTWKLGMEERCEDAYQDDTLVRVLDQQLEKITEAFREEPIRIGRILNEIHGPPTGLGAGKRRYPPPLVERFPAVHALVWKAKQIAPF